MKHKPVLLFLLSNFWLFVLYRIAMADSPARRKFLGMSRESLPLRTSCGSYEICCPNQITRSFNNPKRG